MMMILSFILSFPSFSEKSSGPLKGPSHSSGPPEGPSLQTDKSGQTGSGAPGTSHSEQLPEFSDSLINKLSDVIASKLKQQYSQTVSPFWKAFDVSQPTISSEVIPEQTTPPNAFGVELISTEKSDNFDAKHLLQLIPKPQKQKAISLLNIFEQQPNDISFDSAGNVYINSESVPKAKMSVIFPALYKKRTTKATVPGLEEVVIKLTQMNAIHLTNRNPNNVSKLKGPTHSLELPKSNWW